ncbi:YHYH protein [Sediminibacterium soli]|uniref:YHYH protein n=1 Tax=Sediminibacterium soli TaxID=2698829 RepID=UPI00137B1FCA|nr:YHYH protein [Sediminibacterium soli]NCI45350.1 YHYH protein [Sediminibacterium soli]
MNRMFCFFTLLALIACSKSGDNTNTSTNTGTNTGTNSSGTTVVDIAGVVNAKMVTGYVTVTTSGDNLVLRSDGRPNHKSPYWGAGNALYEAFPTGHASNPNGAIGVQNYTMTIPSKPAVASTHEATSLGPIGMALNGVAIFNNLEMGGVSIDAGIISSFDKAGAHPAQSQNYHYHVTGAYTSLDDANLIGFLRDGFPLYGRKDKDGSYPTGLDAYNGHFAATTEFPNGVYHYHAENVNFLNSGYYILKSGSYAGTKGTFVF